MCAGPTAGCGVAMMMKTSRRTVLLLWPVQPLMPVAPGIRFPNSPSFPPSRDLSWLSGLLDNVWLEVPIMPQCNSAIPWNPDFPPSPAHQLLATPDQKHVGTSACYGSQSRRIIKCSFLDMWDFQRPMMHEQHESLNS